MWVKSASIVVLLSLLGTVFVAIPENSQAVSWSTPVAIGDGYGGNSDSPSSASNELGQMIVAWTTWRYNSSSYIVANRYLPGEGWTGPVVLVENTAEKGYAVVGIDDDGNCVVVWAQEPGIQSRTYTTGVGWGPVVPVTPSATQWSYETGLAVAPDGSAMAIWTENANQAYGPWYASYRPAGGSWEQPIEFQTTADDIMNARLACDGSGKFMVVFTLYSDSRFGVWANMYTPGTGWDKEARIESQTYNAYDLNIAMNRAGEAVVVWQQFGYPDWNSATAFANHYSPENGWGTEVPIEDINSGGCDPPVVSVDGDGNAVSIWRGVNADMMGSCLRTNTYTAGVGWETPATLDHSSDPLSERLSVGIVGSDTYAAWMRVVFVGDMTQGYELIANHHNYTMGWEDPALITADIASSPSVTADNLGGAAIFWFGNSSAPNMYVSQYLVSTPPTPPGTVIDVNQGTSVTVFEMTGWIEGHDFGLETLMSTGGTFYTVAMNEERYTVTSDGKYVTINGFRDPPYPCNGAAVGGNIVAVRLNGVPGYEEGLWASVIVELVLGTEGTAESAVNALGPVDQVGPYLDSPCTYLGDYNSSMTLGFTAGIAPITALLDMDMNTFNLASKGNSVTAYIRLPSGYSVDDIVADSLLLNGAVAAQPGTAKVMQDKKDKVMELSVKFDRVEFASTVQVGENVSVTVTGELVNGTHFDCADSITVINKAKSASIFEGILSPTSGLGFLALIALGMTATVAVVWIERRKRSESQS